MFPLLISLIVILCLLFIYFCVCLILSFVLHKRLFLHRENDSDGVYVRYSELENQITREPYHTYYYRKRINGYIYKAKEGESKKGFVVLSHGKFGTHVQYLIDILLLTRNGFTVLAYDQLGSGLSEGETQESMATGIYVAENVLTDVFKRNLSGGRPVYVYGHSWGAYSMAGALKRFPQIKGAILRSAPINERKSVMDIRKEEKKGLYYFLKPCYALCRLMLEGARYRKSAIKGVKKNKSTRILMVYAMDDPIVKAYNSLTLYFKKHPQENIETFITEKGLHNSIITEESYHFFVASTKDIRQKYKDKEKGGMEEEILSMHPMNHIVYNKAITDKILSFLKQD